MYRLIYCSLCINFFTYLPVSQINFFFVFIQTIFFIAFTCTNPVLLVTGFWQGGHSDIIFNLLRWYVFGSLYRSMSYLNSEKYFLVESIFMCQNWIFWVKKDILYTVAFHYLQLRLLWVKSCSWRGVFDNHYVIKFVNDWRQVCGFLCVLQFPPPIKLTTTI